MDILEKDTNTKFSESFSREALFNIIKESNSRKLDEKLEFLVNKLASITQCPKDNFPSLRDSLNSFKHYFKLKWVAASYKEDRFRKFNEQWLQETINIPTWIVPRTSRASCRPQKEFAESSERSKRRKTEHIRTKVPHDQLVFAARMSERAAGNVDLSKLIEEAAQTPTRAKKYRKIIKSADKCSRSLKLSPSEALAKYIEADLTRKQYNIMRQGLESVYPCYSVVQAEKKKCYPKDIFVSETKAEVSLQNLLDHTTTRLLEYLDEIISDTNDAEKQNMILISKWGCDGSKQEKYKQSFQDKSQSDANVFITSLVPLRLISEVDGKQKVWWQNPVPSSLRFCRPIRFQFVHETTEVTRKEIEHIENQVKDLISTDFNCVKVKHKLLFTMVDGKVCKTATNNLSTMRCYICKKTSKDFNVMSEEDITDIDPNSLQFGLSVLHARIRFLEAILHIAYKLPLKKWRLNKTEKKTSEAIQNRIQEEFRHETGLLIDLPKPGAGNTNDGNTSRRFFEDPETAARITGVDVELIRKLKLILEVLASGFKIDCKKFGNLLRDTKQKYTSLYSWHPMTPTLHKILDHGKTVIEHAILPIGQLSEEAAEARNKHFRKYRKDFARKFSRKDCNTDTMNRLLLTSDIMISSNRTKINRKQKPFSAESLHYLLPETDFCIDESDSD